MARTDRLGAETEGADMSDAPVVAARAWLKDPLSEDINSSSLPLFFSFNLRWTEGAMKSRENID